MSTVSIKLEPKSGNFYAIRAKFKGHSVIDTTGGGAEWESEVGSEPISIIIEARGTAGSKLGCHVTRTTDGAEGFDHDKTHTTDDKGHFSETIDC